MMLSSVINGLFIGLRYLVWAMGVIGIPVSIILLIANIAGGIGAIGLMVATLLLSVAITLMLMPSSLVEKLPEGLQEKRFLVGVIAVIVAALLAGIVYFTVGGFPSLNLLFMNV